MSQPIIELRNLSLTYDTKTLFTNFNLSITENEKVILTGKSGSGKSTLLQILLGFIHPDSGDIIYDGTIITGKNFRTFRQKIAYINQNVTLRPGIGKKVLFDIASFSKNTFSGKLDTDLAKLLEFDQNLLTKNTTELSGGERQRLAILLAVALDRPIFLLDEITSALDAHLKQTVADYFASLHKTVIAISHDDIFEKSDSYKKEKING